MEGYLLFLRKERDAQLVFAVLEHGVLRCYAKRNGVLVDAVQLTRHSVRVVVHTDGVCPNEFAIRAIAVQFDEAHAKLRLLPEKEHVYRFAAPTPEKMRKWGRAIHTWRRYAFVEPAASSTNSTVSQTTAATPSRRAGLREEAETLISFVTSFDLRLKPAVPSSAKHQHEKRPVTSRASMLPPSKETHGQAKTNRLSLPTGRGSQVASLASWIPTRVPSWRRMWSSSSQA